MSEQHILRLLPEDLLVELRKDNFPTRTGGMAKTAVVAIALLLRQAVAEHIADFERVVGAHPDATAAAGTQTRIDNLCF